MFKLECTICDTVDTKISTILLRSAHMYYPQLGCLLNIQFCSDKSVALTITTAYSMISTIWNSGLLSGR